MDLFSSRNGLSVTNINTFSRFKWPARHLLSALLIWLSYSLTLALQILWPQLGGTYCDSKLHNGSFYLWPFVLFQTITYSYFRVPVKKKKKNYKYKIVIFNQETTNFLQGCFKMCFCNLYKLTEHHLDVRSVCPIWVLFRNLKQDTCSCCTMTIMTHFKTVCLWENRKDCDQRYKCTVNGKRTTVTDRNSITLFRVGTSSVI